MIDMHRHLPRENEPIIPEAWQIWFATSSTEEWTIARARTLPQGHRRGYGILPESLEHKNVTNGFIEDITQRLYEILKDDSLGYIGEIGFDSRFEHCLPYALQKDLLRELFRIAHALQRPVVLHHVGPIPWLEDLLTSCNFQIPVLIHGFIKSIEVAQQFTQLGATISLGPSLWKYPTKLAERLYELTVPFLIETDYPNVPSASFSGVTYENILKEHVAKLAILMHVQEKLIEEQCDANAKIFTNW